MQAKIILAVLFLSGFAQAKFDVSNLHKAKGATPELSSETTASKRQKLQKYKDIDLDGSDLKKIQNQLIAVDLILKSEKSKEKKIDLFLRKANLQFMAAHLIGLKRTNSKLITGAEKTYLDSAEHILNVVTPHVKNQNERMATIWYLRGSVLYELDKGKEGREAYITSLRFSKTGVYVPGATLIIAEQYFDEENFQKAIQYYTWIYPRLNAYQKVLANYKVAWCFLSMREYPKAETYFLSIAKDGKSTFAEDALRDLSFSMTQYKSEDQIIDFGKEKMKDESLRARFYENILRVYYQQDKKIPREKLFAETLQLQKTPQNRLALLFLKAQFDRRETPNQKWVDELQLLTKEYIAADSKVKEKFLFAEGADLEDNLDQAVKVFTDAYTGKLAVKERQSKPQLGKSLNALIEVSLTVFPKSTKVAVLYDLWIDLCSDMSDTACLTRLQAQIEKKEPPFDKDTKSLERVWIEQVNILDKQITDKNPQGIDAFITKSEEFIKKFPNNSERLNIIKKIATYDLQGKKYEAATPYLQEIYKLEPKADNLALLYQNFFQLKKYQEVIDDTEGIKYAKNEKMAEFKREAHLQMAISASGANDFKGYESHLKQFLNSHPSKDKAVIAYLDYFNKLLDTEQVNKFQEEWHGLSAAFAKDPRFNKIKERSIDVMKDSGIYVDDESLFAATKGSQKNLDILLARTVLNKMGDETDNARWAKLSSQHRHYFIGLLSVYDSAKLISFLKKQKVLDRTAKKALYFATLMQKGTRQVHFQPSEITLFKELVPATSLNGKPSKLEARFSQLAVPGPDLKPATYNKRVENFITDLRFLRKKVPKELKGLQYEYQISLLKLGKKKEEEGAQAILGSPLPMGLAGSQVEEYQKGVAELAHEFEGQAAEYAKIQEGVDKAYQESHAKELENELPLLPADQWAFPKSDNVSKSVDIAKKTSVLAALIYLDSKLSKKQIEVKDYYWARSGLLLRVSGSEVMRDFLKSELTEAGQEEIIRYWKGQKS